MSANFLARPTRPEPVSAPPPIAAAAGAIGRGRSTVARKGRIGKRISILAKPSALSTCLNYSRNHHHSRSPLSLSLISHIVRSDLHARCQIDRDCTKEALLLCAMRPLALPSQPVSILFLSSSLSHLLSLLGPDDAIGDGVHVPPRLVRRSTVFYFS